MTSSSLIRAQERLIGPGQPCFVIAEAGVNHNGDPQMAKALIDVAAAAGADAVKFITFNPDTLITKNAAKARYQKTGAEDKETFYQMLLKLHLSYDVFRELSAYAQSQGLYFMSKGYKEDLEFLYGLGVPMFKIDSASIVYYSHLRKAAGFGLPIVLSTGTATLGEVERALQAIQEGGNPPVILLHCTTGYPTPPDQVNLRAMLTLQSAFGTQVGLSDHSEGIEVALAAVALGATVIEKHITLDRNLPGPDHKASLEPEELKALVKGIRKVETALGNPRKAPTAIERENMVIVRRSLVAEVPIRAGERFSLENVAFKRPSGGLGEDLLPVVLERVAACEIAEGAPITWNVIGGLANG